MTKYTTISLPTQFVTEIKEYIGKHGYVSVAEFVKDACRKRMEEI